MEEISLKKPDHKKLTHDKAHHTSQQVLHQLLLIDQKHGAKKNNKMVLLILVLMAWAGLNKLMNSSLNANFRRMKFKRYQKTIMIIFDWIFNISSQNNSRKSNFGSWRMNPSTKSSLGNPIFLVCKLWHKKKPIGVPHFVKSKLWHGTTTNLYMLVTQDSSAEMGALLVGS